MKGSQSSDYYWRQNCIIDVSTKDIHNRALYVQTILQHHWKGFYKKYAVALCERILYAKSKSTERRTLGENEVVVIKEDKTVPQKLRRKGKTDKFRFGRDGFVSVVMSKVNNHNQDKFRFFSKPIQTLILLEINQISYLYQINTGHRIMQNSGQIKTKLKRRVTETTELKRK